MSTTKTVKVTNGKILNYTITKPGYKTVHGSKLITADSTININMIPESDSREVYTIGDRIGGVATFFTYYTDEGGNKYAVFVADARYRVSNVTWGPYGSNSGLPRYDSYPTTESANKESATYNSQYIFDTYYPEGSTNNPFPAFKAAKDAVSIPSLGAAGVARLPNPFELLKIYQMRATLDTYDPTVADYTSKNLSNWRSTSTCYEKDVYESWRIYGNGGLDTGNKSSGRFVIPVFEIPVN